MQTQSRDTSPEMEQVQINLLRQAGLARRFRLLRSLTATTRRLSWQALSRTRPGLTIAQRQLFFAELLYGNDLASALTDYFNNRKEIQAEMGEDIIAAMNPVVEVLEALGIPYLVGGS